MTDFSKLSNDELIALYKEKKNEEATYEAMQMALKIALNSLYGAQANQHFRYYSTDIAEGITLTGQLTIQYISNALNEFLNKKLKTTGVDYVVACDTDSALICLDSLVEKVVPSKTSTQKVVDFLDKFVSTVLEPFIAQKFEALADYMNAFENKMHMKREAIADRGIWRAKKNYILQVYDNEGVRYSEPKLKMVGIETARSSTPEIVRKALEKCLIILLNQTEEDIHKFVKDFREEFMNSPIEDIAFPRGVSDLEKWVDSSGREMWITGAPIHVKASLVYNELLRSTGLIKRYPFIRNGDKIKFVYLKIPNPVRNNAIAFVDFIPLEFQLEKYIDRETQFEKTFLEPLRSFTSIMGWNTEKVNTLSEFFSEEDAPKRIQVNSVACDDVQKLEQTSTKRLTSSHEVSRIRNLTTSRKKSRASLEEFFN
jgi:DNA polymerase elongation subunit (family B)